MAEPNRSQGNQGNQANQGNQPEAQKRQPIPLPGGEIIIEIDESVPSRAESEAAKEMVPGRCRNVLFSPAAMVLRGRWARERLTSDEQSEILAKFPAMIPGQCVAINPRGKTARIFDPLNLPEKSALLARLQRNWKENINHATVVGQKDVEYTDLNPNQIKTWLWWMARLVEGNLAKVVKGELPRAAEIERMPGKIRIEIHNNSSSAIKFREDLESQNESAAEAADALVGAGR